MFFRIFLILLFPLYLFADEAVLVNNFINFLPKSEGYLLLNEGDKVITDFGADKNIFKGMTLDVLRSSKTVLHPITGEVLAQSRQKIGQIEVVSIYDKYSEAKVLNKRSDFLPGDSVVVTLPYKVNLEYFDVDNMLINKIEERLLSDKLVLKDQTSPFTVRIYADKNIGLALDFLYFDKLITSLYSTKLTLNEAKELHKSIVEKFETGYEFLAVCSIDGKNKQVLLADEKYVDIYSFASGKLKYSEKIDEKFNKIVSIDCADLNKNGADEIFITISDGGRGVKSYIYEKDNSRLTILKDNFPFIIRAVLLNGQKRIVTQRVTRDGRFLGRINFLEFNGDFVKGDDVPDTTSFSIYGFGLGDVNGDGMIDILRINDKSNMEIYSKGDKIYESVDKYGDSTFYYTMMQRVLVENTTNKDESNRLEELKSRVYIKDRIFVDKKGQIWTGKVVKADNVIPTFEKYFNKTITANKFSGNMFSNVWSSGDLGNNVSDFYFFEDDDSKYIFTLKKSGGIGFWSSSNSELIIFRLDN